VQITRLRAQLTKTVDESERVALCHLLDWANKRRKKLARRAEQTLSGQDFDALAPPLREMLDAVALRAQAPSMTYSLLAELAFRPVSEAARSVAPSSAATPEAECWHDLRLALKRLRYAAELLEPELGPTYEDHHHRAKQLQQLLGDLQDGVVFERIVRKRKSKARRRNDRELVQGLQALLDRATQQHLQLVERCREHCAQPAGLFDIASS
jgi:CHAD domain-containing protein